MAATTYYLLVRDEDLMVVAYSTEPGTLASSTGFNVYTKSFSADAGDSPDILTPAGQPEYSGALYDDSTGTYTPPGALPEPDPSTFPAGTVSAPVHEWEKKLSTDVVLTSDDFVLVPTMQLTVSKEFNNSKLVFEMSASINTNTQATDVWAEIMRDGTPKCAGSFPRRTPAASHVALDLHGAEDGLSAGDYTFEVHVKTGGAAICKPGVSIYEWMELRIKEKF
jgi:hypothetical protein